MIENNVDYEMKEDGQYVAKFIELKLIDIVISLKLYNVKGF